MASPSHGIGCGDNARLVAATVGKYLTRYPVTRLYDDGYGPIWIYQDAGGLLALIRARSWETAYSICEDVVFDDADESDLAEYDPTGETLPEGCGYRPNGGGDHPWCRTGVYQTDLNGESLRLLDESDLASTIPTSYSRYGDYYAESYGIRLLWASWDDDTPAAFTVCGTETA